MNGNVTPEGIRKDMQWMKRVGIAGLQAFDAGQATPQVVTKRLPYMTDGWKAAFKEAATLADRLDLELGIAASPGWSETGGPWVTAPDAMKKMAWSETRIAGGKRYHGVLPKPPTTTGVFQTSVGGTMLGGRAPGQNPPEYYADQKVIAVRAPDDSVLPVPTITSSGGTLDAAALSDGDITKTAAALTSAKDVGGISWIRFDYGKVVVVRGLTVASSIIAAYYDALEPSLREGTPPSSFRLDASDDGVTWRDTGAVVFAGRPQRTISVDSVKARYFRFVSIRPAQPAPQPVKRFSRPVGPVPDSIDIRELVLRGEPTVHSFEEKAAFYNNTHYYGLPGGTAGAAPKAGEVIDLTDRMQPDGTLDWQVPRGNWVVLRIGYSLTGAMNRPASPEATGLEVDKLDPAAVKRYMDHYLGMYRDASGGLMGERGLHAMMFDSWEASNENWTPKIIAEFTRLRGYDPTPWLPALAGFEIGNAGQSDAFLFDWRRTLQQLLKVNHYEQLTAMLHDIGMIRYGEAHEELFATMGDGMEMKQSADVPMAAMWQVNKPGEIEPVYYNDIQESASVAHIYGQNITAAESLTGGAPFGSAPWDLKPTADAILLAGVNRFVIHTSAHQPIDKGPGMTLGVGQYFTRNETWAEQAKPWVDYLSRASFMLQQGRGANDVAVFYGEAGPVIGSYREIYPAVPEGYRYDYVNADVIINQLGLRDGHFTTRSGMDYRALFLGRGAERITLPVLEKLRSFVEGGATLIGPKPLGSPSLSDDPARVKAIIDLLWPGGDVAMVGKGRVFAAADAAGALAAIGLAPDVTYAKPQADSKMMFIHRKLEDGDAYFLSNRHDRAERIEASFRVAGLRPELWDPATGQARPVSYRTEGGRTLVDIPFDRFGSIIVLFRGAAPAPSRQVAEAAPHIVATISGPWDVTFQPDRGAPAAARFDHLSDFRANADPGIRYFSGIATYRTTLDVPRMTAKRASGLWLDLGDVRDLAEVVVNGTPVGTVWKPPYRVDISRAVRPGRNIVDVRSVNLWVNRLIGDVQPGATKKVTFTAADGQIDATTARGRSAQMPYKPDAPLRPSGLLGPVTLVEQQ
ncbi:glycosyl hydrolase [Sphingomonas sp. AP4-R1]|uniref:glycosyl hydrolase n=1 Tax=Sphingomonas sp. AP4-R1 TaxID=2735134 RepID=UPI0020A56FE6|nr:glycosyl hydrolase [Sphingomonas sp. AP4-R1]